MQMTHLVESEYRSVCLKLFSRYAERARRGATVAGDHLRGTAVVVENAPKSLSRHDGASVVRACRQRCEELVAETLVVPFCVIVHYVFGYRCAQVSLTDGPAIAKNWHKHRTDIRRGSGRRGVAELHRGQH